MLRTALRSLAARKLRLALTAVAVVLGVAFVTGTLVVTDTAGVAFDEQFTDVHEGVDLVIRTEAAFGAAMGVEVERDPVSDDALRTVRSVPGVRAAHAQIQGQALLFDPDGKPIVPGGASAGQSWVDPPVGAFELRSGAAPAGADEVVIDAATAGEHGFAIGDSIDVQADGERRSLRISGTAGFGQRDGMPNATMAPLSSATTSTCEAPPSTPSAAPAVA